MSQRFSKLVGKMEKKWRIWDGNATTDTEELVNRPPLFARFT
ncbi:hypothetical protein [Paenibacillus xylanexedens]|nr:hypothetical protein [Paenibacillus xylanexedens]